MGIERIGGGLVSLRLSGDVAAVQAAELVDVLTNQPLPGYSLADCDPFAGDSLDHAMTWNGQAQIPAELIGEAYSEGLPGRVVLIRFHLERARLFSFSC